LTREDLGLPANWEKIEDWIGNSKDVAKSCAIPLPTTVIKNPEIPLLENYGIPPSDMFWKSFPSNYPTGFRSGGVNVSEFENLIKSCQGKWTWPEKITAEKALKHLRGEKRVRLIKDLPPLIEKNAKSAIENGSAMTDVLATWLKKGFVAGPFNSPPGNCFRSNPLMAAVQKFKVRPILNLSAPKGKSFNDSVDSHDVDLLCMSSPKLFGDAIRKAGRGAVFSKTDIQDAYKLIPNAIDQWHLYGFEWLGKFFFDTTTVFGSKAAPAFFDPVPETIVNVVCTLGKIPKTAVHRQLDDVPMVSQMGSGLTERFTNLYREVCNRINVPLAPDCEKHEKAFGPSTFGTVLGVNFDSMEMTWSLSAEKEAGIQKEIDEMLNRKSCSLLDIQRLHGKLSDFSLACEFMTGFRHHLIQLLAHFGDSEPTARRLVPERLKEDLWIWKKVVSESRLGFPLGEIFKNPPLGTVNFVSDAAGAALEWVEGISKNVTKPGDRGVASVGHKDGKITSVAILKWPVRLLVGQKSRNGAFFGSKSATLEMVGLLLPFLTNPKSLRGKHIVLQVDNKAVIYSWKKKYSVKDPETSLLVRTLHVIEAFLECKIYVIHLKRMSNNLASLGDSLSREETTTPEIRRMIDGIPVKSPAGALTEWLKNPLLDWDLPQKVLNDVKTLCT
jgi:hypothetical protein